MRSSFFFSNGRSGRTITLFMLGLHVGRACSPPYGASYSCRCPAAAQHLNTTAVAARETCQLETALATADDRAVWTYAAAHGLAVVSKDADFQKLSVALGPPPKVVWLRVGNRPTRD